MSQVFSLRAKRQSHVDVFLAAAKRQGVVFDTLTTHVEAPRSAVEVEFTTEAPLTQMREVLQAMSIGHMMLSTLRPVPREENSMTFGPMLAYA